MSTIGSATSRAIELGGFDVVLFVSALAMSVVIGVYFANKNKTLDEYMLGGRDQRLWPVATSMMTSFMSGLTMIGNAAEFYYHGSGFSFTIFAMLASTPFTAFILLPVFHRLGNISVFNYLEQRFSRKMQRTILLVFIFEMALYNAMVLYVPSLSLRSVLGISETISIGVVGLSCIVYSTLGGIKAVIWTDFFQAGLMYLSLLSICVGGTIEAGGFSKILSTNQEGGRLVLDSLLNLDSTSRHTIYTIATGSVLQNVFMNGANQIQVQRALSLPTLRLSQWASLITTSMTALVSLLASYIGLIIYTTYQHCDPYENHEIDKRDSLVIHYVATHLSFLPGLRGLFVSGIFAATLSTLSSYQNSMSALVIEDFIKPNLSEPMSEKKSIYLGKGLALLFGVLVTSLTFVVGRISGLLQVSVTLHGALGGIFIGAYFLGMMTRFVNTTGITVGIITSFAAGIYVQMYQAFYRPPLEPSLPIFVDGCANNSTTLQSVILANTSPLNQTGVNISMQNDNASSGFRLEDISYLWVAGMELVICAIVSMLVSLLTGGWSQQVEDKYLVSWLHSGKDEDDYDDDSLRRYSFNSKIRDGGKKSLDSR